MSSRQRRCIVDRCKGFSLIEVLAAMAILVILVLMLARVFSDSSRVWLNGAKKIENNIAGRSAIDFMARELSSALVCSNSVTIKLESNADTYLSKDSDRIYFVSLNHRAERRGSQTYRSVQQVVYYVGPMWGATNRYCLYRTGNEVYSVGNFKSYEEDDWWSIIDVTDNSNYGPRLAAVLAENVRNFEVFVYDSEGNKIFDYDSALDGKPAYMEIYLEMLGEQDAILASVMPNGAARDDFLTRMSKRYVSRIYFDNMQGYAEEI